MSKSLLKIFIALGIASAIFGVVGGTVWRLSQAPAPTPIVADVPKFVGVQTCAECHAAQATAHARSGHARTFCMASESPVSRRLKDKTFRDPERDYEHRFHFGPEGLSASIPERLGESRFPLQFAFGSGRHAVSFLTLISNPKGGTEALEHRVTAFGAAERLDLTPGTRGFKVSREVENHGVVLPEGDIVERCIECHTTRFKISGTNLTELLPNVTCESCHGPGERHVAAMRAGESEMHIRAHWNAQEQLEVCGVCHRRTDWMPEKPDKYDIKIVRFQPVGLSMSKCFIKSEGELSCLTCHDPHDAPSEDRPSYDVRCLNCHSPVNSHGPRKACPVSPQKKCVECHMPRIEVHKDFIFSDHWIRVRNSSDIAPLHPFPAAARKN